MPLEDAVNRLANDAHTYLLAATGCDSRDNGVAGDASKTVSAFGDGVNAFVTMCCNPLASS